MKDKEETIKRYGKKDGNDNHRWEMAIYMGRMIDCSVSQCFIGLINLEEKNLIELVTVKT